MLIVAALAARPSAGHHRCVVMVNWGFPMTRLFVAVAVLLGLALPAFAGGVVVPAEERIIPFSANLPSCEDGTTLWWIKNRFDHTQSTFWNSSLEIVNIDRIREVGFRSNGVAYIPRRYCVGRAELSDNRFHTVVYQIQERTGLAGYTDGFEWCVVGYDHDFAYAPACSALRPLIDRYANDKSLIRTR